MLGNQSISSLDLMILERGEYKSMKKRFTMPVAVHVFLMKDNKLLMLRRYNTGYEDGNYSVIAGHLDGSEEVVTAACREAYEEAGITIKPEDVQIVNVMHRKSDDERIDYFVRCTKWTGEIINKEPGKCDNLEWFDINDLPDNSIQYIKRAVQNYQSSNYFDSFGFETVEIK